MDMVKDQDIKEIMAYTRPEYIVPYDTTITQYIDKHYIKEVDRVKQELSEWVSCEVVIDKVRLPKNTEEVGDQAAVYPGWRGKPEASTLCCVC